MSDDEQGKEEFAVKSRKGDFGFWKLNLGMGPPLGATHLAAQTGGLKKTDPSIALRHVERDCAPLRMTMNFHN